MEINKTNVSELLNIINAKPTKDLGQNFLIEPTISNKIVDSLSIGVEDKVLEVGPGLGSLTNFLFKKSQNVVCVDIDEKMIFLLKDIYKEHKEAFVLSDIRKHDVSLYTKIIGNIPYNITTELVTDLLLNGIKCREYVLMIQAEALSRFIDISGKEYGPASILVHTIGEIKKMMVVKPGAFYPTPKCNSVVFKIVVKDEVDRSKAREIYKMAKALFTNRRKTILNNLGAYCGKEKAKLILEKLSILENTRPEQIDYKDYIKIYEMLK